MLDKQLEEWVNGNPIHDKDLDCCCPDFSCCQPTLLAPKEVRHKFNNADEKTRNKMLIYFLSAALTLVNSNKKVYIAEEGREH